MSYLFLTFLPLVFAVEPPVVLESVTASSRLDWTTMRVEAIGKSKVVSNSADYSKAELRSMDMARKNLQNAVYSIELDSEVNYQHLLNRKDSISRNIESIAKRYEVSDVIYVNGNVVESTVFLDMHELLRPYLIERAGVEGRVPTPKRSERSGIIIDARSLDFTPIVLPTIHTQSTEHWLSVDDFSSYTAQSRFPFMYATDATNPAVISKVGRNPALFIADATSFDTLTVHGLDKPITESERKAIMGNGRVVILLSNQP